MQQYQTSPKPTHPPQPLQPPPPPAAAAASTTRVRLTQPPSRARQATQLTVTTRTHPRAVRASRAIRAPRVRRAQRRRRDRSWRRDSRQRARSQSVRGWQRRGRTSRRRWRTSPTKSETRARHGTSVRLCKRIRPTRCDRTVLRLRVVGGGCFHVTCTCWLVTVHMCCAFQLCSCSESVCVCNKHE